MDLEDDFQKAVESKHAGDLSDNVVEDIVHVGRGNVVGNEEPFVLSALQYGTAWFAKMNYFLNSCLKGPPAGGKTQTQSSAQELIPSVAIYGNGEITDFSDNAALDDPDWDRSLIFIGDEYDKINSSIQEYFKSMAGEDGGFAKKRNVEDSDADGGYSPDVVSSSAIPYQFLYAPTGRKQGIGEELGTRMMKLPVDDTRNLRQGIFYSHFGYENMDWVSDVAEYIYDTHKEEAALRAHLRELPIIERYEDETEVQTTLKNTPTEPSKNLIAREGAVRTVYPRWVPVSIQPIVDLDSTHTNRVGKMISAAIRSSATWNHHQREWTTVTEEGDEFDAIVIDAQDVANVLSCQQTLLATTHLLDQRKLDVLEAVRACNEIGEATLKNIRDWLSNNDRTVPSESKLRKMLKDDLAEEYYVSVNEGAGPKNADLFSLHRESALNIPRTSNLQRYTPSDRMDLDGPHCNIDLDDPYSGCTDPIRNQPFLDTVHDFEQSMSAADDLGSRSEGSGSKTVTTLEGAMGGDDVGESVSSTTANNDSDPKGSAGENTTANLSDYSDGDDDGEGSSATEDSDDDIVHLTNPITVEVYQRLLETNGDKTPYKLDGHDHSIEDPHFIGVVDTDVAIEDSDLTDTIYDPSHSLWNQDGMGEERGSTWEKVDGEIDSAIEQLRANDVVEFGQPSSKSGEMDGYVTVSVDDSNVETHVDMEDNG